MAEWQKCDFKKVYFEELTKARNELNNIRQALRCLKYQYKGDVTRIEELVLSNNFSQTSVKCQETQKRENISRRSVSSFPEMQLDIFRMKPIGYIKSQYSRKNGTPRQGIVAAFSRGELNIQSSIFTNPSHSLEGLEIYSHVWIVYIFHQNNSKCTRSKVSPPRLDGKKQGVFATRSPHRPNALGLTLAKLDKIKDGCLHLSGLDLINGTPVLDIKPYIPQYDSPALSCQESSQFNSETTSVSDEYEVDSNPPSDSKTSDNFDENFAVIQSSIKDKSAVDLRYSSYDPSVEQDSKIFQEENITGSALELVESDISVLDDNNPELMDKESVDIKAEVTIAEWIKYPSQLEVIYNPIAEQQISQFSKHTDAANYRLEYLTSPSELRMTITSILSEDPRSIYRRHKCKDRLYFFTVDSAHVTAWFFDGVAEVLRVLPLAQTMSSY